LGWRSSIDNFGVVLSAEESPRGAVYRSDQMNAGTLEATIRRLGVKTVLNLRGSNPGQSWYDAERSAVIGSGAEQIDIALSSSEWMSRQQASALADVIREAPRPLLIHCYHGSERTALASAMAHLLEENSSVDSAASEFTWKYLYFGLGDGVTTFEQFDSYRRHLLNTGTKHSPAVFAAWLKSGFEPRWPTREQWPYDPYPIVVRSFPPEAVSPVAHRSGSVETSTK
jgi:protein tyrosine phosphatase (PTP) superfamily phosphohydrolase (DUF442 family)